MVGIIGWLDNVVGIGTLVVGVCGFSSFEDVSARVIPSMFNNNNNNIIIIIALSLIVGENKPNLHASWISISSYGNAM